MAHFYQPRSAADAFANCCVYVIFIKLCLQYDSLD